MDNEDLVRNLVKDLVRAIHYATLMITGSLFVIASVLSIRAEMGVFGLIPFLISLVGAFIFLKQGIQHYR